MAEQTQREITKSFADGMTAKEVSTAYGISTEDAGKFAEEHANEITARKNRLEREGWK